jgi:hypothetical protein
VPAGARSCGGFRARATLKLRPSSSNPTGGSLRLRAPRRGDLGGSDVGFAAIIRSCFVWGLASGWTRRRSPAWPLHCNCASRDRRASVSCRFARHPRPAPSGGVALVGYPHVIPPLASPRRGAERSPRDGHPPRLLTVVLGCSGTTGPGESEPLAAGRSRKAGYLGYMGRGPRWKQEKRSRNASVRRCGLRASAQTARPFLTCHRTSAVARSIAVSAPSAWLCGTTVCLSAGAARLARRRKP